MRNKPPPSLSVHAQCFWEFTPSERNVMKWALTNYAISTDRDSKAYRTANMLLSALDELSTQD